MKRFSLALALLFVLGVFAPTYAAGRSGKFEIGAYGGYSFGFGHFFKEDRWGDHYFIQNKATFSFGCKAKYGLTRVVALVGIVDYQSGKLESKTQSGLPSRNWHWIGYQINMMFFIMPDARTSPYITLGGGYYIRNKEYEDSRKGGINAGVGLEHLLRDDLALDAGARVHCVAFTGGPPVGGWYFHFDYATYVQVHVGLLYYFDV